MRCSTERTPGSYDRGSALNIATVTKVICDTLTSCGADQTALDNCAKAAAAAKQQPEGTGAQADAFNAVFGLKTVSFCSLDPRSVHHVLTSIHTELLRHQGRRA